MQVSVLGVFSYLVMRCNWCFLLDVHDITMLVVQYISGLPMGTTFRDRWFALPNENDRGLNPVKDELVTRLRLNRSNGWIVLELALEIHSDVTA